MDPDLPSAEEVDDDKKVEKQIADDQNLADDLLPRHVDHRIDDVINNVNGYHNGGDTKKYKDNDDDDEVEGDLHEMDRHAVGHVHHNNNNIVGDGSEQHAIVQCTTTAGRIIMHMHRDWSPNGYDRAVSLFERGYYDNSHFFRVVPHFLVQFGISYTNDQTLKRFADSTILDDPKRNDLMPFREGMMSFAGSGPNSRSSQLFIAYDRAGGLGNSPWETPFGEVVEGMNNVNNLYSEYGDMPPWGKGPQQGPIRNQGSRYIEENFPNLDKFEKCTVKRVSSLADALSDEEDVKEEEEAFLAARDGVDKQIKERYHEMMMEEEKSGGDGRTMRGSVAAAKERTLKMKSVQNQEAGDKKSIPLYGKLILVTVALVLLQLLFARRKKSKHAEKSV